MHDDIKKFSIQGIVGDEADVVENRGELIRFLEGDMREQGYAPVLDMDPQYTQSYDPENEQFDFLLSVYGAYVGEDLAWKLGGMMHGKMIFKYIPKAKLLAS